MFALLWQGGSVLWRIQKGDQVIIRDQRIDVCFVHNAYDLQFQYLMYYGCLLRSSRIVLRPIRKKSNIDRTRKATGLTGQNWVRKLIGRPELIASSKRLMVTCCFVLRHRLNCYTNCGWLMSAALQV